MRIPKEFQNSKSYLPTHIVEQGFRNAEEEMHLAKRIQIEYSKEVNEKHNYIRLSYPQFEHIDQKISEELDQKISESGNSTSGDSGSGDPESGESDGSLFDSCEDTEEELK